MFDPNKFKFIMDPIELLEHVDNFYNSAWNKIILFTSILFAIVGVFIPLLISWLQKRALNLKETALKNEMKILLAAEIEAAKSDLNDTLNSSITKMISKLKEDVSKELNSTNGRVFHLQGNVNVNNNKFKIAIESFINAGNSYLKGENYINLNRVNLQIVDNINHLTQNDIDEIGDLGSDINIYVNELKNNNKNNVLSNDIRLIKSKLHKIKSS